MPRHNARTLSCHVRVLYAFFWYARARPAHSLPESIAPSALPVLTSSLRSLGTLSFQE